MTPPLKGDRYSMDSETFVCYQTRQHFALEGGISYFQKDYFDLRRGQTIDVVSKNLEITFSPMWRIVGGGRVQLLLGGTFALVNDFTTENFQVMDDYGLPRNSNSSFTDAAFYSGTVGVVRVMINKHFDCSLFAAYKFDVGQMWGDQSPYANSKLSSRVGISYYLF